MSKVEEMVGMDSLGKRKGVQRKRDRGIAYRFSSQLFSVWPVLLLLGFIWPFGGGGQKVQMMAGNSTPGARGTVIVKQGSNGNREIEVKTQSLAKPDLLRPPRNAYVVWLQEPDQQPQNVGQLRVDNNENGDLHTVTAFRRFKIFITAEQNPQTHSPEGTQVLSAEVPPA